MSHDRNTPQALVIFSLTDQGQRIGEQLTASFERVTHLHRPEPFIETVQSHFTGGSACVFICATGIVIRALAPVLKDKHQDPPVVVLDEHGRYAIPLLSGHEGGAGELAFRIATVLDAQCVVTSHTDYSQPVYAIGMGCDRGCPEEMLTSLYVQVRDALASDAVVTALASIDLKHDESSLINFSQHLGLPFVVYSAETLRGFETQLSVKSQIVFKEVGCYGVAEGAALCAASRATGQAAELVVTKRKNARATIAIARSYLPSRI